jgi:hypothetical protein
MLPQATPTGWLRPRTALRPLHHFVAALLALVAFSAVKMSAQTTENITEINDTDPGIVYTGTWSYSANRTHGEYQADVHFSAVNGDSVSYTFNGTGISFITETNTDEGNVSFYIDNVLQQTVSCNSATRVAQVTVFTATGLSSGTHTLKAVKVDGTYMLIDALTITTPATTTITSADGFFNRALGSSQPGSFSVDFDASVSLSPSNTNFSLCQGNAAAYTGLACMVRFNSTGTIDARNGGAFAAVTSMPFTANTTYHIRMDVNVATHTYSVSATAPGGSPVTIASNYAFRSEQAAVTSLDTFDVNVNATPGGSASFGATTVSTTAPTTFTITASAGGGGTISPSGGVIVNQGSNQTFAITANSGFSISSVTVDGTNVGAVSSYTFSNVQANHTISATFAANPTFTITASAGANGTISPSGTVPVNQGANQAFTIAANSGYSISSVTVDGTSVGAVSTYTFSNVQANHTISATFVVNSGVTVTVATGFYNHALSAAQTGTFTATFDASASISPSNALVGLSQGSAAAYTDIAVAVRFNPSGAIDARNGGAFAAASTIPFTAGTSYHFRLVVNVPAHTFSAYVTPPGGSETAIGTNYAFRTEQAGVTQLAQWNADVNATPGGSMTVSNMTVATLAQVAAPTFTPAGGTYSSSQTVSLATTTGGASIRYTTDGSTPTSTTGTLYTGPITVSSTKTIKAIAFASGMADSAVSSATYTISSTTNYTPAQVLAGVQQRMVSANQVNTKPHINTMTRAMNVNVYQVNTGVFAYTSSMAVDTDGSDPDPDPDHQSQTTWTDDNGVSLGAHHVPYYVLGDYCYDKVSPCPHFYYAEHNITGLQFALIFYNGKCIGAVFGDTQGDSVTPTSDNDSRELGEASVDSAALLGIPSSGTTGGVSGGVTVVIFSGSSWVIHGTNSTLQANAQAKVQTALNTLGNAWGL